MQIGRMAVHETAGLVPRLPTVLQEHRGRLDESIAEYLTPSRIVSKTYRLPLTTGGLPFWVPPDTETGAGL